MDLSPVFPGSVSESGGERTAAEEQCLAGREAYNSYFVVPTLKKQGKYNFSGFATGNAYNSLPFDKDKLIELEPGQILFLRSLDYLEGEHNDAKRFFGLSGSYSLRPAKDPSELKMLQWLYGTSSGSGWESSIPAVSRHWAARLSRKQSSLQHPKQINNRTAYAATTAAL